METWGSLPTSLGSSIVCNWLALKDILRLESACLSHSSKATFTSFIAGGVFDKCVTLKNDAQCRWIKERRVLLKCVELMVGKVVPDLAGSVLKLSSPFLSELKLVAATVDVLMVRKLGFGTQSAPSFPRLAHLSLIGVTMTDADFLSITENSTQLVKVQLALCRGFSSAGFRNIWEQSKMLHTFDLEGSFDPASTAITEIVANCKELESLRLVDTDLTSAEMVKIIPMLPKLSSISLSDADDEVVYCIAKALPDLQSIWLRAEESEYGPDSISSVALTELIGACRKLTSVSLMCGDAFTRQHLLELGPVTTLDIEGGGDINDEDIMEFVQRCPALTTLMLSEFDYITVNLSLRVLDSCPLLTWLYLGNESSPALASQDLVETLLMRLYPRMKYVRVVLDD